MYLKEISKLLLFESGGYSKLNRHCYNNGGDGK